MATYARRPAWEKRVAAVQIPVRVVVPLGLVLLVAVSAWLRLEEFGTGYWIDEGISVGIADRPFFDVFDALRLDGSPPVYYLLLNLWIAVAGSSEEATHGLSLLFALLAIPVAWWAARGPFGARAAWMAAVLAAVNSFLTHYAQETRMYSLVILLGIVAGGCFVRAFVTTGPERTTRGWAAAFALTLATMLYTHNWSLFFGVACGLAWLLMVALSPAGDARRALARRGLFVFGAVAVLYLPWLPSTLYQAQHTGAPWALAPELLQLGAAPRRLLGGTGQVVLLLAAGTGLARLLSAGGGLRGLTPQGRAVLALLLLSFGTIVVAWTMSQLSPAWANRYLAIGLGPLLLVAGAGLGAAGRLGLVGLALAAALWAVDGAASQKSNVRAVAEGVAPSLAPGDLVISTQPEQIPVLDHYLPSGLRYATLWGTVTDVGVTDWRDGVERLEATSVEQDLEPQLNSLQVGRRLVLIQPTITSYRRWSAPWTKLIRVRSKEWTQALGNDPRFQVVSIYPPFIDRRSGHQLNATVYVKARP